MVQDIILDFDGVILESVDVKTNAFRQLLLRLLLNTWMKSFATIWRMVECHDLRNFAISIPVFKRAPIRCTVQRAQQLFPSWFTILF